MIYYYSATGNTRFAARYLAKKLDCRACDILENPAPEHDGDSAGFMFPIYCWGIPPVAGRFIEDFMRRLPSEVYVWGCCTCGDEAGTAMRTFDAMVGKSRGRGADALWSIIMPNTYVMLPGFDVDPKAVEEKKLDSAPGRMDGIAARVAARETGIYDVKEGSLPSLRSALFPVFRKWGVTTRWWRASDACIGCGKCSRICPAGNVEMDGGRPRWGETCFSCCACFHVCPVRAVAYSSFTRGKGQYLCPW